MIRFEDLLRPTPAGLYCPPGDFHVDPVQPVDRAVITHGHADHARPGHGAVLATPRTFAIMAERYGAGFAGREQPVAYGETVSHNGVEVTLVPAGHVLGSAQAVVRWKGVTMVAPFQRITAWADPSTWPAGTRVTSTPLWEAVSP